MKLWSVQVLRFVAALIVAHLHAVQRAFEFTGQYGMLGGPSSVFGRCGVDLFFVISGLIITRTARGLSAPEFLGKRVRRIMPLYLLVAVPWIVAAAVQGDLGWRDVLATAFLWPATDVITAPLMPVGWTLCFEALFYAAFALVIWRPRAIWLVGGVFLMALALRKGALLQFVGNPIILEFLAGVALAYAPKFRPAVLAIPVGVAFLIAGAVLKWPPFGEAPDFLAGTTAWIRVFAIGVPSALIVWGSLQIEARPGLLTYLGDTSYALYLVHAPIILAMVALMAQFTTLGPDAMIVISTGTAILVAWRAHELFEKPMLAFLARPTPASP